MQIQTTMIHCFTPVRMAVIKKIQTMKCWQGFVEKGKPRALLVGM